MYSDKLKPAFDAFAVDLAAEDGFDADGTVFGRPIRRVKDQLACRYTRYSIMEEAKSKTRNRLV
jgi:hypothetical protein